MIPDLLTVDGKLFPIVHISSKNKHASARFRQGTVVLSIPSRWSQSEKNRISESLLKRASKAIQRGRWILLKNRKLQFRHGQTLCLLGQTFNILVTDGLRSSIREDSGNLLVISPSSSHTTVTKLVKRSIIRSLLPKITSRVYALNDLYFRAKLAKITLRDNSSLWGSCTRDNSISLNFKLLFMPEKILDYVIIHELAHTKYRGHGKRFWDLVVKLLPDAYSRRKWLKENGNSHIDSCFASGPNPVDVSN